MNNIQERKNKLSINWIKNLCDLYIYIKCYINHRIYNNHYNYKW